jgi:hypothetical protein
VIRWKVEGLRGFKGLIGFKGLKGSKGSRGLKGFYGKDIFLVLFFAGLNAP